MEMEEINIYEFFDLSKPILPEIYSIISHDQPILSNCDHARMTNTKQQIKTTSINSCWDASQEITNMIVTPTSSSSSNSTPKLFSFENSNTLLDIVSTNPDHNKAHNYSSNDVVLDEIAEDCSLSSQIINFSSSLDKDGYIAAANNETSLRQKRVCTETGRTMLQARDHLMAERKRRENLGQLFISLSKVVPGLKKLDKASLLGDAINYLKALQERVSVLEEEMSKKNLIDGSKDDYESSINNKSRSTINESSEIKARISDRHVLIKIHCKKQKGFMSTVPCQMERMHLNVLDMRIMQFGDEALDITVLAEMKSEFRGTVKDIVDRLQTVFFNPRRDNMQEQDNPR